MAIHLGTHDHLVVEGKCRKDVDQVKALVHEEVSCTPLATQFIIVLVASKMFLSQHLVNKDGEGSTKLLKGKKLHQMMVKFLTLYSFNVRNLVASFKHCPSNKGYISNILAFKANSGYDYIQDSCFPRQ